MSRRLSAVAIPEPGSKGGLLPPPPAAGAQRGQMCLSGPLGEGSSSAHGAAVKTTSQEGNKPVSCEDSKQHAEGAGMCGDDRGRTLAQKGQEPNQRHSAALRPPESAAANEGDDDDFGSFMNA